MKELQTILKQARRISSENCRAVLATVVDVRGSSYRLPGAKMLIYESGETFGTVSGGCLEADVLERAKRVSATGEAEILLYDTTRNDDSVFSLNMGCRGVIRILLETASENDYFEFVRNCFEQRLTAIAATVIHAKDETDLEIGSRVFVTENTAKNDFANDFAREVFAVAQRLLTDNRSQSQIYETPAAEIFLEVVRPPIDLIVFGAGADAVALAESAKNLGWRVSVVDHRRAFATTARFPFADEIVVSRAENLNLRVDENSAAIVMTHNYEHDRIVLKLLLKSAARYVGALGPKRRTENILRELNAAGENFTADELQKLYAPVGLDIGATAPETIALSILAEIETVFARRTGSFLRDRHGSIYNRQFDEK